MKKVAVIADATSAEFFFPFWHRYYASQFGAANLHVVTYAGMKPLFSRVELGNLWEVSAKYDDTLRVGVIADLISALLRSHDVVLRCDVDEFLVPDPAAYANLAEFVECNELPYVTARGVDVIEMEDDAPLDQDQPVFGVQRRFGVRSAALNKTCLTTVPLRWAPGFHAANVPPHFSGLYNLHMKFANIKSRIAWHERMLEGLEPGSKEYKYFAVGAEHLTGVQRFLAARPREGAENEVEFDKRFLDSVRVNPQNGIHQGDFLTQDFLVSLERFAPVVSARKQAPPPQELIRSFESLGHNCEFGFVAGALGAEESSLLRWAYVRDVESLIAALRMRFKGLFEDPDRLVTRFGQMVEDPAFGIAFHTKIKTYPGPDGNWHIRRDEEFPDLHRQELEKIAHQRDKFLNTLARGEKILVYKENAGVSDEAALRLHEVLQEFGRNRVLVIDRATDEIPVGSVVALCEGLYRGFIERFSPYDAVDDIELSGWTRVLEAVGKLTKKDNLALHKPALMSSLWEGEVQRDIATAAAGGNDGRITGGCGFHTAYESDPWWQVDLGAPHAVQRVVVYNRMDLPERCTRMGVYASTDGESWTLQAAKLDAALFGGADGNPYVFNFSPPFAARYVRIGMIGEGFLHLDEVEVFGAAC